MDYYLKTKDYFNTQEEFELRYKQDLDMLVTYPIPSNLDDYYNHPSYISHTDTPVNLIDKLYLFVKTYSLKSKKKLIKSYLSNGSLLDIGAGTGSFLAIMKDDGWKTRGVEPNPTARKRCENKQLSVTKELSSERNKNFDVITLWHVLEHLPNLEIETAKIASLTNTNGYLFIAVPNYKSFDARYYKQHWAAYDVPRHLWHFSKQSIPLLFSKYGFSLVRSKPMVFDSFYVSLLSEKYKNKRTNYLLAFIIGLLSNFLGLFTKNYSSHIYVLKKDK